MPPTKNNNSITIFYHVMSRPCLTHVQPRAPFEGLVPPPSNQRLMNLPNTVFDLHHLASTDCARYITISHLVRSATPNANMIFPVRPRNCCWKAATCFLRKQLQKIEKCTRGCSTICSLHKRGPQRGLRSVNGMSQKKQTVDGIARFSWMSHTHCYI